MAALRGVVLGMKGKWIPHGESGFKHEVLGPLCIRITWGLGKVQIAVPPPPEISDSVGLGQGWLWGGVEVGGGS